LDLVAEDVLTAAGPPRQGPLLHRDRRAEGAPATTGGERALPDSGGYFVEPTIFDAVQNTMTIARDEIRRLQGVRLRRPGQGTRGARPVHRAEDDLDRGEVKAAPVWSGQMTSGAGSTTATTSTLPRTAFE
jgi:hypothetical protein